MDLQQQEDCSQQSSESALGSPCLLTQPFAAVCLDENRDERNVAFSGAIAPTPDHSRPTSPESETNTIAAATKTAAKDVFDILPPEIIDHVLSFMSIPTLFKCSVLSRRWSRRVLPKLWHAPFMIYYVSWMKLLQHLSTCPLPLRERGETADGRCSDDTRPAPQDSSNNHRPTAAITDFSLLLPPLLSPDKSPPLAHRRLSSQFTSSSCWSSTTSYLYRFPTLDRLSTSPPSHQHPRASFSPSHSAHRTASWKTYHHPTGRRRRRRSSYDDAEQQEQMLAAILGGVPRYAHYIRILDFSQLHYIVSDRLLTSLIPHTPFLTELIVEEPKQLSDDSLISIAASSTMLRHHLKRLELHHCRRITDRGLSAIVQHCTQLDTVRLSGGTPVTDRIINMMAHLLAPTLRRVDFSNAALVTSSDPGLMTLAIWCQRDPASTSASQMDDPLSTRSSPTTIPPAISSSSPLLPTMPTAAGLVDCRFSGCQGITDSLIARLANLEVLHVAHCYEVTDQAMMSVAARSPDLVELDITACWAITDRGILAVGRGCPKLRRLILEEPFDVEQVEREGEQEEEEEEEEEEGRPMQHLQQLYEMQRHDSDEHGSLMTPHGQEQVATLPLHSSHAIDATIGSTTSFNALETVLPVSNYSGHAHIPSSSSASPPARPRISKDTLRAFAWGDQVLQRRAVTHSWRCARIF